MAREPKHLNAAKAVLAERGEMKAGDLANAIGVSPATLLSGIRRAYLAGELKRRQEGRNVWYRLPEEGDDLAEAADGDFNAALWADGDLVLVGVALNTDGRSVTLNPKQAQLLRRLLNGVAQ